jgi:GrpB-like predicted nucleotidyltransferase (UPF0157 family)
VPHSSNRPSSEPEAGYSRPVEDDRRPVVITPYDPDWPLRFEAERALLEAVLAAWLNGGIHHIGSTAIPGLAAKPIIDIMAGVRDLEEARAAFASLLLHTSTRRTDRARTISPSRPGHGGHTRTASTSPSQEVTSGANASPSATPCEPIPRWLPSTRT